MTAAEPLMYCMLESQGACCCTCRFHLQDFHHCTTSPAEVAEFGKCVCSRPKGWICKPPEMEGAHSGWSEHGICEMHVPKQGPQQGEFNATRGKHREGNAGPDATLLRPAQGVPDESA